MRGQRAVWAVGLALLAAACGGSGTPAGDEPAAAAMAAPATAVVPGAAPDVTTARADRRVVFLGDSLTAGLGLPADEAFPALIAERLASRGQGWTVVNAGVSGDTSAGGLRRLDWSIGDGAAVLVVALGGNDALRGLPAAELEKNLDAIVSAAVARGVRVLLAGMEAPPNNGPEYTARFHDVYPAVARRHGAALVPFLLDGVAGDAALNQADGIHPNRDGARKVADTIWRELEPIVRELETAATR